MTTTQNGHQEFDLVDFLFFFITFFLHNHDCSSQPHQVSGEPYGRLSPDVDGHFVALLLTIADQEQGRLYNQGNYYIDYIIRVTAWFASRWFGLGDQEVRFA